MTPAQIIENILNYCTQARFGNKRTAAEIARALRREFILIPVKKGDGKDG